jgi:hypothetical protein
MNHRTLTIAVIAAVALAAFGATFAGAAKQKPKNGGFESGHLSGWQVADLDASVDNTWYVYSGSVLPDLGFGDELDFFAPPQGNFAAVTRQGGTGTHILHRVLKLKKNKKHKLKMRVYYDNQAGEFASPDTLDSTGEDNQQYRVDVMKKGAPIDSVEGQDVLKEVFGTEPGDPLSRGPKKVKVNLTQFAGKKVRLRFAEVDNLLYFHAAVDAVKLKSKPKK